MALIACTRYLTPTVEDILVKLKGAAVYKMYIVSTFHQIELADDICRK